MRTRAAAVNMGRALAICAAFAVGRFSAGPSVHWLDGASGLVLCACAARWVWFMRQEDRRDEAELRQVLREIERHEKGGRT